MYFLTQACYYNQQNYVLLKVREYKHPAFQSFLLQKV